MMKTVSFLASHGGSAARAVIDATKSGALKVGIGVVITNNRDSFIFRWCADNGIPVYHISGKTHPDEVQKDEVIRDHLLKVHTDFIVLSGYMKKIGTITLTTFKNRILNIHPSLLPKHGGKGLYGDKVHESVLASGDKVSGATVQLINEEYDEGPILAQQKVPVLENDSVQSLKQRVQEIEGSLYIKAIEKMV